jgi:hypothetical protein
MRSFLVKSLTIANRFSTVNSRDANNVVWQDKSLISHFLPSLFMAHSVPRACPSIATESALVMDLPRQPTTGSLSEAKNHYSCVVLI